jgi:hypothetical protein
MFGTEPTDIISHKRWLAILGGGLLPVISLTSLHFFVKYEEPEKPNFENDRDLEIVSLMDLETTLEKEEQEKPKVKKGRKKKEVEETKVVNTEVDLPKPIELIETDEPKMSWFDVLGPLDNEETKEVIETPIIDTPKPIRPTKLTYTKPNVTIDRPL